MTPPAWMLRALARTTTPLLAPTRSLQPVPSRHPLTARLSLSVRPFSRDLPCFLACASLTRTGFVGVARDTQSAASAHASTRGWRAFSARPDDWKTLLAEFQRQASAASNAAAADRLAAPPMRGEDVGSLVELCAANDRHREAIDVIRRSEALGVRVPLRFHVLVCCSVARKRGGAAALERMRELATRFPDEFNDSRVYDPLITVLKDKSDYQSVHAAVAQMHELKLAPHLRVLRVLMVTAGLAGQKDAVRATIDFANKQFPESKHDIATLTAACQALVKVGESARVMAIYKSQDAQWLAKHATTRLWNQFLVAAIDSENKPTGKKRARKTARDASGDQPGWMAQLDQMRASENGQPDDFTFATCLFEWDRRGDWDQVLELFNAMQEHELRTGTHVINALACSVVIRALHKIDAVDGEQASESGEKAKSDRVTISRHRKRDLQVVLKKLPQLNVSNLGHASTLIDTLDEFRLFTPARQLFERLLRQGVIRDHPWRQKDGYEIDLHTFSRGVAKCAVVFAFEEITKTHRGLITAGQIPDDLRIITGVGKRSQEYMVPVLKREITELLTRSSRPALWPATHPTNPGVLLVRHNALRKWLQKDGRIRYF